MGKYPEISLKEARERREEARRQLAHGVDPSQQRQDDLALLGRELEKAKDEVTA